MSGASTPYLNASSPWQNGIVARFNGHPRDELLSFESSATLAEAHCLIERWWLFYNHRRIQHALRKRMAVAFAAERHRLRAGWAVMRTGEPGSAHS